MTPDPGSGAQYEVTYPLPATADAPALARRFVDEHGASLGEDLLADARLLVSELVTNAVLHGRPEITLTVRVEPPGIGVLVFDGGPAVPDPPDAPPDADDPHGRGLHLVSAIAQSWGIDSIPGDGKTVWFDLRPARLEERH